ncbi:MAG: SDR family NAD(P)-dependent oxidoreductase [Lachnospiraceae bacterium]|nr:SDR family NAD(P)-dependent oxidoreductase [Lachnospiraceae bacterium]
MLKYDDNSIRFEQKDIEQYYKASGDNNPLHMDKSYGEVTIYGEQVVFGMLGVETLLKQFQISAPRLDVKFNSPLFIGRKYSYSRKDENGIISLYLLENQTSLLEVKLSNKELEIKYKGNGEIERQLPMLFRSRRLTDIEIEREKSIIGKYKVSSLTQKEKISSLEILCRLQRLLSYLVGMVVPGERALFAKSSTYLIELPESAEDWDYRMFQVSYHDILGLVDYQVEVLVRGKLVAVGKVQAYIRADFGMEEKPLELLSETQKEKTVVILGGTKGLGAEIARHYVLHGAAVVITYRHSKERAQKFCQYLSSVSQKVELIQSDVGSDEDCKKLKQYLEKQYDRIDRLYICAAQAPRKLEFYPENYQRFEEYLTQGVRMFYYPFFNLKDLVEKEGKIVIISSIATIEKLFFHNIAEYICVKSVIEIISECTFYKHSGKRQYFVARPSKMLTEMNNTPTGRVGAQKPEEIAGKLIEAVEGEETEGKVFKYLELV